VWEELRHEFKLVEAQTDSQEFGFRQRQEVPHLREDVCIDACFVDAYSDPQPQPQVSRVWKSIFEAVAIARTLEVAHGSEAVPLHSV